MCKKSAWNENGSEKSSFFTLKSHSNILFNKSVVFFFDRANLCKHNRLLQINLGILLHGSVCFCEFTTRKRPIKTQPDVLLQNCFGQHSCRILELEMKK